MNEQIRECIDFLNNEQFEMTIPSFVPIVSAFSFYYITQYQDKKNHFYNFQKNESKIIIIDEYENHKCHYLIICFDKTLIIISITDFYLIKSFFENNKNSKIFFIESKINLDVPNEKEIITEKSLYLDNISNFLIKNGDKIKDFWNAIR